MLTGTVRIDLTTVDHRGDDFYMIDRQMMRAVGYLQQVPDDARVVLIVADLMVGMQSVRMIREHVDRLHFDVQGDPETVRRWLHAIRTGELLELAGLRWNR